MKGRWASEGIESLSETLLKLEVCFETFVLNANLEANYWLFWMCLVMILGFLLNVLNSLLI
jgi:hypothetical protein